MKEEYNNIIKELGEDRVLVDEPLSSHTHIGIGGPADLFFVAKTRDDLVRSVQLAIENKVPFTVLGWGSNTLISDKGLREFVIRNEYSGFEIVEELGIPENEEVVEKEDARQVEWNLEKTGLYDFRDLDYTETGVPEVVTKVASGMALPVLIIKTIQDGITGLQWFAGIPGTIAGAVYNNIHGGKKLLGPLVQSATIIDGETGEIREVEPSYFGFGYDESKMHANKDVLVDVTLKLQRGDKDKANWVRMEWAKRKSVQPQNSLGCTFANPPESVSEAQDYKSPSIGYFVEQVLGWSGKEYVGGASMGRANGHAAFICNEGSATAHDYVEMMNKIRAEYLDRTGYKLRPEIFLLGEHDNWKE